MLKLSDLFAFKIETANGKVKDVDKINCFMNYNIMQAYMVLFYDFSANFAACHVSNWNVAHILDNSSAELQCQW